MNNLLEQRFFRLLSEYSQRKVSASEFAEAIEELAIHLADFSINEQDYSVLLRYFSFGLHRLKLWRANLCATFLGNLVYPTPASKMLHFP